MNWGDIKNLINEYKTKKYYEQFRDIDVDCYYKLKNEFFNNYLERHKNWVFINKENKFYVKSIDFNDSIGEFSIELTNGSLIFKINDVNDIIKCELIEYKTIGNICIS